MYWYCFRYAASVSISLGPRSSVQWRTWTMGTTDRQHCATVMGRYRTNVLFYSCIFMRRVWRCVCPGAGCHASVIWLPDVVVVIWLPDVGSGCSRHSLPPAVRPPVMWSTAGSHVTGTSAMLFIEVGWFHSEFEGWRKLGSIFWRISKRSWLKFRLFCGWKWQFETTTQSICSWHCCKTRLGFQYHIFLAWWFLDVYISELD